MGKALLIMAGLMVGITALVAIITTTRAFSESVSQELDAFGFNIVAYPASANLSLSYGGMTVSGVGVSQFKALRDRDVKKIKSMPEADYLAAVSPKALRAADIGNQKGLVVGIDFAAERSVKKWWKVVGFMPAGGSQVLVGSSAAKMLGVKEGSRLTLGTREFTVSGVLAETGSQDDNVVFADLSTVWRALGRPGEIDLVEMTAKNTEKVEKIVGAASKAVPEATVSSVKQAVQYKQSTMASLGRFGLGVTAFVVAVAGFIVFATMMGSVRDRTSEIGVFRAVGFRKKDVARIIYIEALTLSFAGGVMGALGGFGLAAFLPRAIGMKGVTVRPEPLILIFGVITATAVGLLASALPARRAADMDPAEALKAL